ncbi:MAG: hypothetical protein WCE68_12010 [Anaerolineales bacterium]
MLVALNWVMLLLAIFTATGSLFSRDWRWSLGLLAIQYLSVFWMVQSHWPVSMAAVKLITGWMACAILGIAQLNARAERDIESTWLQGRLFHVFAAGMVLVASFALSLRVVDWLGLSLPVAWGSLLLIGLGLLHLGITSDPFQVIIGLLTVLAGFEIMYAAVESSALVTALLVVVNLGLAMAGAYFLNISPEKKT